MDGWMNDSHSSHVALVCQAARNPVRVRGHEIKEPQISSQTKKIKNHPVSHLQTRKPLKKSGHLDHTLTKHLNVRLSQTASYRRFSAPKIALREFLKRLNLKKKKTTFFYSVKKTDSSH